MDVVFAEDSAVQPDVVYLSRTEWNWPTKRIIGVVPDLLVEVSSPSTRRLDLIKKRNLYEREGVRSTGSSTWRPTRSMSTGWTIRGTTASPRAWGRATR
jgi:hypothetical protein